MSSNRWNLILYSIALKWRWILYIIAALIVFVPILIVLFTGKPFDLYQSKVIVNTAITFVIAVRTLTILKRSMENRVIPWASIGGLTGLLIVLFGVF